MAAQLRHAGPGLVPHRSSRLVPGSALFLRTLVSLFLMVELFGQPAPAMANTTQLTPNSVPGASSEVAVPSLNYRSAADLLNASGVSSQLQGVAEIVLSERQQSPSPCLADIDDELTLQTYLKALLAPEKLVDAAASELMTVIDPVTLTRVNQWFRSRSGRLIRSVERASALIEDDQLGQLMKDYLSSERWTPRRKLLISEVLMTTNTAEFVTAFNTGILSLSNLARRCNQLQEPAEMSVKPLQRGSQTSNITEVSTSATQVPDIVDQFDWYDSYIARVIAAELVPVSGTIMREVPDRDLEQLVSFAQSDAGVLFHSALVESTVRVLKSRVATLRQQFRPIPESAAGVNE